MEYFMTSLLVIWGIYSSINLINAIEDRKFEKWHWISQAFFFALSIWIITTIILIFIFEHII